MVVVWVSVWMAVDCCSLRLQEWFFKGVRALQCFHMTCTLKAMIRFSLYGCRLGFCFNGCGLLFFKCARVVLLNVQGRCNAFIWHDNMFCVSVSMAMYCCSLKVQESYLKGCTSSSSFEGAWVLQCFHMNCTLNKTSFVYNALSMMVLHFMVTV